MFGAGMMLFGGLLFLAFWGVIIAGAIWLVVTLIRASQGQTPLALPPTPSPTSPPQTPLEILKLRYAKGEITKEQFEEMRRNLGV